MKRVNRVATIDERLLRKAAFSHKQVSEQYSVYCGVGFVTINHACEGLAWLQCPGQALCSHLSLVSTGLHRMIVVRVGFPIQRGCHHGTTAELQDFYSANQHNNCRVSQ